MGDVVLPVHFPHRLALSASADRRMSADFGDSLGLNETALFELVDELWESARMARRVLPNVKGAMEKIGAHLAIGTTATGPSHGQAREEVSRRAPESSLQCRKAPGLSRMDKRWMMTSSLLARDFTGVRWSRAVFGRVGRG